VSIAIKNNTLYTHCRNGKTYRTTATAVAIAPYSHVKIVIYHEYLGMGRVSDEVYWRFYEDFQSSCEENT